MPLAPIVSVSFLLHILLSILVLFLLFLTYFDFNVRVFFFLTLSSKFATFFLLYVLCVLYIRKPRQIYSPAVVADPHVVLQLLVFDTGSNPDAVRRPGHAKPFPLFACSRWEFHCCRLTCAVQIFYARLQGKQTAAQPSLQTQGCPLPLMLSCLLLTLFGTVQFFQCCLSLPAE